MLTVITGGSGAIGSMCAYEAARLGYDILLCYNENEKAACSVLDMLADFNVKIELISANLTDCRARRSVCEKAAKLGGTDILVNNAGIACIKAFADTDENETAKMLSVNLASHIDLTREILPQMLKKRSGSIVNVSSAWGVTGASCEVLYSSAKAGVIGFTKSLAKELAPSGITVNCVAPGCIRSPMLEGLDGLEKLIPLGRVGDGLDIAKAIFFLARHGYITGQTLSVDGGMVI